MKPKLEKTGLDVLKETSSTSVKPFIYPNIVAATFWFSLLTLKDLHWEVHISVGRGLILFVLGLLFFVYSFFTINSFFAHTGPGKRFVKNYGLSDGDVLEISNKIVSGVQAIFCCATGLTSTIYSCSRDVLKTSHYISEAYAWFGAAYFFYDIWSMYVVYKKNRDKRREVNGNYRKSPDKVWLNIWQYIKHNGVIIGHHLFIGMFGFLVITHLRGGFGDCFFGFVYLMEASTPFVSFRGILSILGQKNSKLYVYNGIVMLIMFFICRVIMFPYTIYAYGRIMGLDFISAVLSLPKGCLISIAILLLPQIYWFYLMLKGATKMYTSKKNKEN